MIFDKVQILFGIPIQIHNLELRIRILQEVSSLWLMINWSLYQYSGSG
jgi:hypothetical protein